MKKIKYVYHSSEIPHLWANQSVAKAGSPLKQPGGWHDGPSGPYRQIYFEGAVIWSYGSHYQLGELTTYKGVQVALINGSDSSVTTNQQRHECHRACEGLIPVVLYTAPGAEFSNIRAHMVHRQGELIDGLFNHFKGIKFTEYELKNFAPSCSYTQDDIDAFNNYCDLLGMKDLRLDISDEYYEMYFEHVQQRINRDIELQSPEEQARRAKAAEKRAEAVVRKNAELVTRWRNGEVNTYKLPQEVKRQTLLRINGDVVETSHGARVPLREALILYRRVVSNVDVKGTSIGHYSVDRVNTAADKIKIGCHLIRISEAALVLGEQTKLKIVSN